MWPRVEKIALLLLESTVCAHGALSPRIIPKRQASHLPQHESHTREALLSKTLYFVPPGFTNSPRACFVGGELAWAHPEERGAENGGRH